MTMNTYDLGNVVLVTTNPPFTQLGAPIDPTVVKVVVKKPDGSLLRATYLIDLTLTRISAGAYQWPVTPDQPGLWTYRWYSTGAGQASARGQFEVNIDDLV
jgi:hypothetical protein